MPYLMAIHPPAQTDAPIFLAQKNTKKKSLKLMSWFLFSADTASALN